ncbi:hypothetical protein LTR36_010134 [Oleoguttula mirabilis]|uniref:F-box domain-containing protein n=1 Tax=Oleoguttula mirabilis TaxID=1507867 RepID=A0AAV9JUL4_9PEZI|nr:hypothetical protein LTR36_010134 [Oleoguttula mirabilis]
MAGDLTLSGLLYEGNYGIWIVRMDAVLKTHFGQYTTKNLPKDFRPRLVLPRLPVTRARQAAACEVIKDVATVIRVHVQPNLLARVPQSYRDDGRALLACLQGCAKPFRILGLPVEIRMMVYEHILPKGIKIQDMIPITHVSRLMRKETLPLYFARISFRGKVDVAGNDQAKSNTVTLLARKLADNVLRDNVKQLRSFTLCLEGVPASNGSETGPELHFTFSADNGLRLTCTNLPDSAATVLQKHVTVVEANRKTLRLQGEAIILALISKPELWVHGGMEAT